MSKTKTKSAPKVTTKTDVLSKVKGSSVSKPAQSEKVKSKELAKKVATKETKKDKKNKVPVKEPTPEPSSEEEEDDDSSSEEESDSEDEVETKVPVVNGKTKDTKIAAKDDSEDSESDESASEDEESDEEVAPKTSKPTVAAAIAKADSESESESDSEGESSDESDSDADAPVTNGAKTAASDDDSASDDDDDDASSDESDSDESEESGNEEVVAKPAKRKADDEDVPAAKKSKVDENAAPAVANLFVGNLSWNIDEDALRSEFEEFGELSGVRVMIDRSTGRSKGFGYVEFVNAADAGKAHAAKQGAELDGRAMNVDFANPKQNNGDRQENRRKSYGDQLSEATDTLFLGNLSFECTSDDVSDAFSPHGTIMSVRLPTDRETGAPKGFGYVTFSSVEEATAALEAMQGGYIARRAVRLDYSQPRQNTGDSPARGGFGGRGRGGGGFTPRGRGGGRGDFGGRGGGGRGRGASRGGRGGSTNRGGFGDFSGRKTTF